MICINIFHSIPLLKQYLDISLNSIEQRVYDNVFAKNIDKRTCKRILDSGKLSFISDKNYVTQQGSIYTGVYLVAHLKKTHQLVFIENGQEIFRENKAFTWMGLIEYDMMRKAQLKKEAAFKWPISIYLDTKKEKPSEEVDKFEQAYPEPLYVYYFEFEKLQKLYTDENGIFVRNALHSVWLEAMCHKIIEIDMKVSKFLGKAKPLTSDRRLTQDNFKQDENNKHGDKGKPNEEPFNVELELQNTEDNFLIPSNKKNEKNMVNDTLPDRDNNINESQIKLSNRDKPYIYNEDSLEKKDTYLNVKNNQENDAQEEDSALSAIRVHDQATVDSH
jgi:hypothetical protein